MMVLLNLIHLNMQMKYIFLFTIFIIVTPKWLVAKTEVLKIKEHALELEACIEHIEHWGLIYMSTVD